MAQDFPDFDYAPGGDDVRTALLNLRTRTISMETSFSGSSLPTAKAGKISFKSDESAFYACTQETPSAVWQKVLVGTVPVTSGGTGSTTSSGARSALGLGASAVLNVADSAASVAGSSSTLLMTPQGTAQAISANAMKVRATGTDTAPGVLFDKLVAGTGIQIALQNSGANESLLFTATGSETGDLCMSMRTSKTGWILANGLTIGNAASGATGRANADTLALYTILWDNVANTELPIQDSTGALTARGANAAADFAAGKRLPIPDIRGRVVAGRDNMGTDVANRLTTGGSGIIASTLGAFGGAETHTLTITQMPRHRHSLTGAGGSSGPQNGLSRDSNANNLGEGLMAYAGGDLPHNNTQPTYIANIFIKL